MTVLLSYTPSPQGEAAIPAAIREAQLRDVPLVVVNVLRGGALVENTASTEQDLAAVIEAAEQAGVPATAFQIEEADVVSGVLEAVQKFDAQLLVIGLRRRSPVGKLLMGSIAQRLLLEAPCAVLTVKPAV
ncbi:universal stress protein [Aeromicrobium sp. 636]|uniref:Universal stress protein n=1 Tax=Aeromicrobium senzhongii TaxID=2663859 RepID=A0A8I0EXU1_9ACTN|nr:MULTISPECIES: universal stress protein [Aeromicrobium]MBC9227614.1 universal stress protein [Aeromicrobium senzhongii]MCQ3999711.1 universal stress protein [Aeromicrobium sp. 636]